MEKRIKNIKYLSNYQDFLNDKRINHDSDDACNLKHKGKHDFRSMPFKELAFFADVKRKVVKAHRHAGVQLLGSRAKNFALGAQESPWGAPRATKTSPANFCNFFKSFTCVNKNDV